MRLTRGQTWGAIIAIECVALLFMYGLPASAVAPVSGDNLILENIQFDGQPLPHQIRAEIGGCNLVKLTPAGSYKDPVTNKTKFRSMGDFSAQLNFFSAVFPTDYWTGTSAVEEAVTLFDGEVYSGWNDAWTPEIPANYAGHATGQTHQTFTGTWQHYNLAPKGSYNSWTFRGDLTFDVRFDSPWGESVMPIEVSEDSSLNDVLYLGPVTAVGYGRGILKAFQGREILKSDNEYFVSNSEVTNTLAVAQVKGMNSGIFGGATDAWTQWDLCKPSLTVASVQDFKNHGHHGEQPGGYVAPSVGAQVFAPSNGSTVTARLPMDLSIGAWTADEVISYRAWTGAYIRTAAQQKGFANSPAQIMHVGTVTPVTANRVAMYKITNYLVKYTVGFSVLLETEGTPKGQASTYVLEDPNYFLEKNVWDVSVGGSAGAFVLTGNTADILGVTKGVVDWGMGTIMSTIWPFILAGVVGLVGYFLYKKISGMNTRGK